jgi:formylglycine-generating enzyme required for sulfatase activity/pimeloyl-ACP methyl ester carboxylesterase
VTAASQAVFLSYASEDTEAAARIAQALRAGGVEVWFDRSELRGGDAWDRKIRQQIRDCVLFLPIISGHTQARTEGYFRLEWRLAEQRTHLMGRQRAFLVPVCVDVTPEKDADVPDAFLGVQWTRLPHGEVSAEFITLVQRLIAPESTALAAESPSIQPATSAPSAGTPAAFSGPPILTGRVAPPFRARRSGVLWALTAALVLIALGMAVLVPWQRREHARTVLLPAIDEALTKSPHSDARILDMALAAERALPNDHTLAKLWPLIATTLTIDTQPAGAGVFWKDYGTPDAPWQFAGTTPLKDARVPRDLLRVEVRKDGFQTLELVSPRHIVRLDVDMPRLTLDRAGTLPPEMVRIPASKTEMNLGGLAKYEGAEVPEFLADKYEVTNRAYKAFVDAGGYANAKYWRFPVIDGGKQIPLSAALARFIDRTGRPGPATWEAGTYPDGLADHPVAGVSWYEAAAYAAWAGKQLPTVYHWTQMADTLQAEFLLPLSNFSGKATTAAGSLAGLSSFGVYDIAGNVREWALNTSGNAGERFILGGGYTEPTYDFTDAVAQPALDRSPSNGFRCIRELAGVPVPAALTEPLFLAFRDYSHEQPVDDRTFAQFARQFVYDRAPLEAHLDKVVDGEDWRLEGVSVNAAYNGERLPIYVFLPPHGRPPYQPVVLFPGSAMLFVSRFDPRWIADYRDYSFVIKSGRALVLPVYKSTFERQDGLHTDLPNESVAYKEHVIMWTKDFSRTLDYLETRADLRPDRIAFLGASWGGFMGGIVPAVEKRIRVAVLNVGGMAMERALPEVDQINYLPRVTQPVLMLNGEYDSYVPVETAQKPFFRLLGTPPGDKKMIVYPSGHLVPRVEFMKETLAWLDQYLGPVR